ncbi:MAG: mechanosensitive ion channel family protein [Spirochaetaceae bacterium]|jgi:small-conductance mechanosensitive channel|nr:mechanosensitive ion channel family protein [Spirochaetaceae bacterium]
METQTSSDSTKFWDIFELQSLFTPERLIKIAETVLVVVLFYIIYRVVRYYINRTVKKKLKAQRIAVVDKIIRYIFNVLVVLYILNLLGINVSALLGAAGIIGVALGFAAQTSMSNIISGFFVILDRSLQMGDFITIGDVSGTVSSINLLSIKLTTLDNQLIRIPNESIIKANIIDHTVNPIRRLQIPVGVSYNSDLTQVIDVLMGAASKIPQILKAPPPLVMFDRFADSSVNLILAVWFKQEDLTTVKNAVIMTIYEDFSEAGISIPFPQMDVHINPDREVPTGMGENPRG